jgi:hypothetical protein
LEQWVCWLEGEGTAEEPVPSSTLPSSILVIPSFIPLSFNVSSRTEYKHTLPWDVPAANTNPSSDSFKHVIDSKTLEVEEEETFKKEGVPNDTADDATECGISF